MVATTSMENIWLVLNFWYPIAQLPQALAGDPELRPCNISWPVNQPPQMIRAYKPLVSLKAGY